MCLMDDIDSVPTPGLLNEWLGEEQHIASYRIILVEKGLHRINNVSIFTIIFELLLSTSSSITAIHQWYAIWGITLIILLLFVSTILICREMYITTLTHVMMVHSDIFFGTVCFKLECCSANCIYNLQDTRMHYKHMAAIAGWLVPNMTMAVDGS